MSKLDHVRHDAVVRKVVDRLEVLFEGDSASNKTSLLLFDLDIDVVLDCGLYLRLQLLDLLIGSVRFPLPVG